MCHPHLEVFSAARGAAKSVFRLLERKSCIDALEERGIKPQAFRGDIVFENVHFSYPSRADVKVTPPDRAELGASRSLTRVVM